MFNIEATARWYPVSTTIGNELSTLGIDPFGILKAGFKHLHQAVLYSILERTVCDGRTCDKLN